METAFAFVQTTSAKTQAAQTSTIPTSTLEILTAIPGTPGAFEITPPKPDQQVYVDPAGWYMIYFPKDWVSIPDQPNFFYGREGSIETGYFPEMGYVSRNITVCVWLANVKLEPQKSSINWVPDGIFKCSVETKDGGLLLSKYYIIENPQADPDHRFFLHKNQRVWCMEFYMDTRNQFQQIRPWLIFREDGKYNFLG